MARDGWDELRMPEGDEDLAWELFHENSKTGRYEHFPSNEKVVAAMQKMHDSLPYDAFPHIPLPAPSGQLGLSLTDAITTRVTARNMEPCPLKLQDVASILHMAYGVTRDNAGTQFVRPFRTIPSGGGLYPLEIFFHTAWVEGLEAGLYHYSPTRHRLAFLRGGDLSVEISKTLVQPNLAFEASLLIFVTAIFERTVFKYGDRGYRFTFLEAGHFAQNVNLVSNALSLGCINIGGYFDREVDELLGLDGLMHSTIYMIGLGKRLDDSRAEADLH
jgi:SagB-type dehydrogenase family enzyme